MALEIVATIADLRARVATRRSAVLLGLVPTMGALHEGHASLIRQARAECAAVVVSIFVNPIQFDRPEDLERYPRSLDVDARLCSALGVDFVFAPSVAEMYPVSPECRVEVGKLADHLCGRFRPGHFGGVATVVLKLFEIVQPDRSYFGEKDAQQLAVVRRLVSDFNVPTTIIGVPTGTRARWSGIELAQPAAGYGRAAARSGALPRARAGERRHRRRRHERQRAEATRVRQDSL